MKNVNASIIKLLDNIKPFNLEFLINSHIAEMRRIISETMSSLLLEEALAHIGVSSKHERVATRRGYLHSSYERAIETSIGLLRIRKQKVRIHRGEELYRTKLLPYYKRRTDKLLREIMLLYFLGASVRKTLSELQVIRGISISPSGISRVMKTLESKASEFHGREISKEYKIIWIDGMVAKVKGLGKEVLLLLLGEDDLEVRELIDYRVVSQETKESYELLLNDLYERGLKSPDVFVHDGHRGLKSTLVTVYPGVKQQDCIKHKQDNVLRVTRDENKEAIADALNVIYSSVSYTKALSKQSVFAKKWCKL